MTKKLGWSVATSLPPELMMRLAQYCMDNKCTRSEAIRQLIERGLDCNK